MKTKKSGIVEALKEKHKVRLARVQQDWKKEQAEHGKRSDNYISDITMFSKWAYRVGKGYYGFCLGNVPHIWTDVLDEFLCWLETQCPDFEIHQVKIKGIKVRLYLGTKTNFAIPDERIRSEISQLQDLLCLSQIQQAPIRAVRKKCQEHSRRP
jgi:hypothetical protein